MKNNSKLYETPTIIMLPLEVADVLTISDNDAEWDEGWIDSYTFL